MKKHLKLVLYFISAIVLILQTPFAHALDESNLITRTAEVARVSDGDTIELTSALPGFATKKVRFLGIQAMEENDSEPAVPADCNATNATARLAELLSCDTVSHNCPAGTMVTLKVWNESSISLGRPSRHVFIQDGPNEINLATQLVTEGYALAGSDSKEWLFSDDIFREQAIASQNNIGPLWNTAQSQCGNGPGQNADLEMHVNWDAEGNDGTNINDEWVRIRNKGAATVNLSNWILRDTSISHMLKFPNGSAISPGQTIKIRVGAGSNTSSTYFMNQSQAIFDNEIPDGAYLFDVWQPSGIARAGHIISHFAFPCNYNCTDFAQGKLQVQANYDATGDDQTNPNGEWVDIKNVSSIDIDMRNYILHSLPKGSNHYNFGSNSLLKGKETMRVFIGNGSSSRLTKYWGNPSGILSNSKDKVWLDTYDSILISAHAWPVPAPSPPSIIDLSGVRALLLN